MKTGRKLAMTNCNPMAIVSFMENIQVTGKVLKVLLLKQKQNFTKIKLKSIAMTTKRPGRSLTKFGARKKEPLDPPLSSITNA